MFAIELALPFLINGGIYDYTQAYYDSSLYKKIIEKAIINDSVKIVLGVLEAIDNLAIENQPSTLKI